MATSCVSNHYYDILVQSCKPCYLRCRSTPPQQCQIFCAISLTYSTALYNDANALNKSEYKPKKDMLSVLLVTDNNLAGLVTTQVAKDDGTQGKNTAWAIWLLVAFALVLIPTIVVIAIMHRRRIRQQKLKMHEDSTEETNAENSAEAEHKVKHVVLESVSCDEFRRPMWQNEEVEVNICDYCDQALSEYLFPLPAIEEGADILVTTKTSVCCNLGAGVKGDSFVEM